MKNLSFSVVSLLVIFVMIFMTTPINASDDSGVLMRNCVEPQLVVVANDEVAASEKQCSCTGCGSTVCCNTKSEICFSSGVCVTQTWYVDANESCAEYYETYGCC